MPEKYRETVTETGRQTPEGYRDTIENRNICRDGNALQRAEMVEIEAGNKNRETPEREAEAEWWCTPAGRELRASTLAGRD